MNNNLDDRSKFNFRMKDDENPTDLSRVILIPGMENSYGRGLRGIRVAGIRTINQEEQALVQYRDIFKWVDEGDEIGGGKILSIGKTQLTFRKDGENFQYDLSRKK